MAKNDNLKDFLTDVADAIREKKGTTDLINPQDFSAEIASIQSGGGSKWTGHADAEGLRAIGWTDDDIAYYQEHGVNWNEEDDQYHLVSDDNKALYGVLTAANISTYKNQIVYLPKIDTEGRSNFSRFFQGCYTLVGIPQLNTQSATNMEYMFQECYSLVCIPPLDTQNVTTMANMFYYCRSLVDVPQLDTQKVMGFNSMFYHCHSLVSIPQLDTRSAITMGGMFYYCYSLVGVPQFSTTSLTNISDMFYNCYSLVSIAGLNLQNANIGSYTFTSCYSLVYAYLSGVKANFFLGSARALSKSALLYIINNEAATTTIKITLFSSVYTKLSADADIVAALANHPNITLASA